MGKVFLAGKTWVLKILRTERTQYGTFEILG